MLMQITFFRVSLVLKRCTGIFEVSNAWINLWNTMMKKGEVKKQNSRNGFEKKVHACRVEEVVFEVSASTSSPYLKLASLTGTN